MVGSTDRCALKVQNPAYGLCSQGVNGVNSDVVMILHLDPAEHIGVDPLHPPRPVRAQRPDHRGQQDRRRPVPRARASWWRPSRRTSASPSSTTSSSTSTRFANVVDALGGVKMYFPEPVYDAYSGLKQLTPGCVHLNGFQALQVVRARHLQYKGPGITTRTCRVLAARRTRATWPASGGTTSSSGSWPPRWPSKGLSNPITDEQLVSVVGTTAEVDREFSASDMVNLVLDLPLGRRQPRPPADPPGEVDQISSGYTYQGGATATSSSHPSPTTSRSSTRFLGIRSTIDTMTGRSLPAPAAVSVSVLNGTGAYNQATETPTRNPGARLPRHRHR